jgi:tRNA (cmo5U34)-methyltransferase
MVKRFSGNIGEEYNIYLKGHSHQKKLLTKSSKIIKNYGDNLNILEIGCGFGYSTEQILKQNKTSFIYAIDNEKIMISKAKVYLDKYLKNKQVKLVYADALEYIKGSKNNSFDMIFSCQVLHNLDSKYRSKLFTEIYNKLKPRGLFIDIDKIQKNDVKEQLKDIKFDLRKLITRLYILKKKDLIINWVFHYLEDNLPNVILLKKDFFKELKKNKFKNIKIIERIGTTAILTAKK